MTLRIVPKIMRFAGDAGGLNMESHEFTSFYIFPSAFFIFSGQQDVRFTIFREILENWLTGY